MASVLHRYPFRADLGLDKPKRFKKSRAMIDGYLRDTWYEVMSSMNL